MGYDITLVPFQQVFNIADCPNALYISGARAARNEGVRKSCHIHAILTIGPENAVNNFSARTIASRYLCVGIKDMPTIQIIRFFPRMLGFIEEALAHGNVLVHCTMGISRSATVVTAYIMKRCRVPFRDALKCLEDVRPYVNPNPGFLAQLREWEKTCHKETE